MYTERREEALVRDRSTGKDDYINPEPGAWVDVKICGDRIRNKAIALV